MRMGEWEVESAVYGIYQKENLISTGSMGSMESTGMGKFRTLSDQPLFPLGTSGDLISGVGLKFFKHQTLLFNSYVDVPCCPDLRIRVLHPLLFNFANLTGQMLFTLAAGFLHAILFRAPTYTFPEQQRQLVTLWRTWVSVEQLYITTRLIDSPCD